MTGALKKASECGLCAVTGKGTVGGDIIGGLSDFATDIWDGLSGAATAVWQGIFEPALEHVMYFLGYEDETIDYSFVSTVKLLSDSEPVKNNLALAVLRAIRDPDDIPASIIESNTTHFVGSTNLFFKRGVNEYIYGTPTVIGAYKELDSIELDSTITTLEGQAITIVSASLGFPGDFVWVKYYLQENEGYSEADNYLYKSGDPIPWDYVDFTVLGSGDYQINLERTLVDTGTQDATNTDSGTHDGANNAAVLSDSTAAWTIDEWVGATITNTTDGSSGTVTANTATTITATLSGGTDNDWDNGDAYSIVLQLDNQSVLTDTSQSWTTNEWVGATITNNTDGSSGTVTANTATTITVTLTGGTDNDWDYGDSYSLSLYQTDVFDYNVPATGVGLYYQAIYYIDAAPTVNKYFQYLYNQGTYPALDASANTDNFEYTDSDMLPIVPVKKNFAYINANTTSEEYLSCYKLVKTLNLDINTLVNAVKDNADESQIRDAYMMFGLPIYSTVEATQKALFFNWWILAFTSDVTKTDYDNNPAGADPVFNILQVNEQTFQWVIKYNYIQVWATYGSFGTGEVGNCDSVVTHIPNDENLGTLSYITYRYQVNEGRYYTLKVHGPIILHNVRNLSGHIQNTICELTTDTSLQPNFFMPCASSIVSSSYVLNNFEREQVIHDSLSMCIYAVDQVHLEWYETPAFLSFLSVVIQVVGIIYLIYTWDPEGTASIWALAAAILYQFAIAWAFRRVLEIYAKDNPALRALATIAYIYLAAQGTPGYDLSSAEALMYAVQAAISAATIEISYQAEVLQDNYDNLLETYNERKEEIEKAQSLLDNTTGLSPLEMLTYLPTNPYESPVDYYERTVHTANPGVLTLDQIENYHDNLLRLPELDINSFNTLPQYRTGLGA